MSEAGRPGALAPYRVLDLTGEWGPIGPRLLAGLGADVVKVEPPSGDPSRHIGPFLGETPDPRRSLSWLFNNAGKRGITLDLETEQGRATLLRLAAAADFLFESYPPGYLESLGLGPEALAVANPRLVIVRVSPFGQDGPYRDYQATDIVTWAMGAQMHIDGDADRPPLRISVPQSQGLAGLHAAAGAMAAHAARMQSGLGQVVDISGQEAVIWTLMIAAQTWDITHVNPQRAGGVRNIPSPSGAMVRSRLVWPCKDGYLFWVLTAGGQAGGVASTRALVQWMIEAGEAGGAAEFDWGQTPAGGMTQELYDTLAAPFAAFFLRRTKAELLDRAAVHAIQLAPVNDALDLLASPHLAARKYWVDVPHPDLGVTLRMPGAPVVLSSTPLRPLTAAPTPGQHTAQVLEEWLGPRADREHPGHTWAMLARHRVPPNDTPVWGQHDPGEDPHALPFTGLKVADFSWVGVGPIVARHLADFGADVIRIESATRPDTLRGAPPFRDGVPGLDRSAFGATFNTNKRGLALNLRPEAGRALALQLCAWADVITESMTPGSLDRLGLTREAIRAVNPRAIIYRTTLNGQTGPHCQFGGYGSHGAALAGLHGLSGWPDRPPAGTFGAYTDFIAPWALFTTLAAALDHRARTGEGQEIEQSQSETGIWMLAPTVIQAAAGGPAVHATGNDDPQMFPHGAFPCAGTDRWVALAVRDAAGWQALCGLLVRADWAADPALQETEARRAQREPIEAAISAWTAQHTPHEAMAKLQAAGVPAGALQTCEELYSDPQLAARGAFWFLDHAVIGTHAYNAPVWKLSRTPATGRAAAPVLGQHTFDIACEVLGLSVEEIAELTADGVFE